MRLLTVMVVGLLLVGAGCGTADLERKRMAANERAAMAACSAYVESQEIYYRADYPKTGTHCYAQRLKGDHSLLETKAGAGDVSLIDRTFGDAEGNPGSATPKAGYCFKVLTRQGSHAPGGAMDYVVEGKMTKGYALIAYPAQYGKTGKNCFIISKDGGIWAKDLGERTHDAVTNMVEFDPDDSWTPL
jgi:hypothetical protein